MASLLWWIGGIVIALGIIASYVIGIRSLQQSRKSFHYLTRQQNRVRATYAFISLGTLTLAGTGLVIAASSKGITLPEIPSFEFATAQPTAAPTNTPVPSNTATTAATSFVITATPVVSATPSPTLEPAVPLVVEGCDPDVLLVRSPLTMDQARVWATIYGLTGQAMMASDRLMDLSDDRVELLRRVFPAVDARPLDLFPSERAKRIWDLKVNHLGRHYDVVGLFNFDSPEMEALRLSWSELGIPTDQPVHVFDFWNQEYLGAWEQSVVANLAPMSCRVLTLLPDNGKIQLISTSRHITQGWVDLTELKSEIKNPKSEIPTFTGASKVVKNDPYELRFAFPRGKNFVVKSAVARASLRKLPVSIFNHQGWAAVRFTSPRTQDIKWEVEFAPTDTYSFPQNQPTAGIYAERVGLDGVNLHWREQYYLNAGYRVYLNGALLGYTPEAMFPIRGLNPLSNYTATVTTIWEDGRESARNSPFKIQLASLLPGELSLTQLDPLRSSGRWRGFEIDEMLPGGPPSLGGKKHERALSAFANSEAEFDLKGLYNQFTAVAGLDSGASDNATVEFTILGDGKELWRSGEVKESDEPKSIQIEISGVHKMVLRTAAPAGSRPSRAQIVWGEPKVSRAAQ